MAINFGRRRVVLGGLAEGHMSDRDREVIYDLIVERRPTNLFEVGFMLGGGSTYYISSALANNKHGVLHSSDISTMGFNHVNDVYNNELPELGKYVKFYLGDCRIVFPPILSEIDSVDFVLLDGNSNAEETVSVYHMFAEKLSSGSLVALHDWADEKCRLVRPILEKSTSLNNIIKSNDSSLSVWEVA